MISNTEFRPRLPEDPFGDTPWVLDVDALQHSGPPVTTTILILNTPPPTDLSALLYASPNLAHSLILIATHDVPSFPLSQSSSMVIPTVRVLKLQTPLFGPSAAGALGVIALLDKASRFASSPMALSPTSPDQRVQVFSEDPTSGEFTINEPGLVVFVTTGKKSKGTLLSSPPLTLGEESPSKESPPGTLDFLALPPPPASDYKKKLKRRTFGFGHSGSSSSAASSVSSSASSSLVSLASSTASSSTASLAPSTRPPTALSTIPTGTRSFDTVINYLLGSASLSASSTPSNPHLPEKVLLRQAILVTTLSAPYLTVPPEPPGYLRTRNSRNGLLAESKKTHFPLPRSMSSMSRKRSQTLASSRNDIAHETSRPTSYASSGRHVAGTEEGGSGEAEGQEERPFQASKSSSSFHALKKRFTITARKSISSLSTSSTHGPSSEDSTHGASSSSTHSSSLDRHATVKKEKRFSLLSRSRTQRQRATSRVPGGALANHRNHEYEHEPRPFAPSTKRYTGRSHIIHVVDTSVDGSTDFLDPYHSSSTDYQRPRFQAHRRVSSQSSPPLPPPMNRGGHGMKRPSTAKPKLVKSIEQFLVAFAYPVQGISLGSGSGSRGGPLPSPSPSNSSSSSVESASTSSLALGLSRSRSGGQSGGGGVETGSNKPVPFVIRPGALAAVVKCSTLTSRVDQGSGEVPVDVDAKAGGGLNANKAESSSSFAECILFGALDAGESGGGTWKAWLDIDARGVLCTSDGVHVNVESGTLGSRQAADERRARRRRSEMVLGDGGGIGMGGGGSSNGSLNLRKAAMGVYGVPKRVPSDYMVSSSTSPHPVKKTALAPRVEKDSPVADRSAELRKAVISMSVPFSPPLVVSSLPARTETRQPSIPSHNIPSGAEEKPKANKPEEQWEEGKTGLLTPPDSSVGSDSGEEEDQETVGVVKSTKAAPQSEHDGGGSGLNGLGDGSPSFDFVQAYMYERRECPVVPAAAEEREERERKLDMGQERDEETVSRTLGEKGGGKEQIVDKEQERGGKNGWSEQDDIPGDQTESLSTGREQEPNLSGAGDQLLGANQQQSSMVTSTIPIPLPPSALAPKSTIPPVIVGPPVRKPVPSCAAVAGDVQHGQTEAKRVHQQRSSSGMGGPVRLSDERTSRKSDHNSAPLAQAQRTTSSGMGTREAQEYANALMRYPGDNKSRTSIGSQVSVGSMSEGVGMGGSTGGRREICSLMGLPPSIGAREYEETISQEGSKSRSLSEGAKSMAGGGGGGVGRQGRSPMSVSLKVGGVSHVVQELEEQAEGGREKNRGKYYYKTLAFNFGGQLGVHDRQAEETALDTPRRRRLGDLVGKVSSWGRTR